jgi:hypothetical protein
MPEVATVWREATEEDYPSIIQCHQESERRIGKELDLPSFDCPAVLAWMVAERDGEIVQFGYMEKLVEWKMGGHDRQALDGAIAMAPDVFSVTRAAGSRWLHCPVPKELVRPISRELNRAGLYESPNVLFVGDLRGN